MSKKRPGVEAALNLLKATRARHASSDTWAAIEKQVQGLEESIRDLAVAKPKLDKLQERLGCNVNDKKTAKRCISLHDLMDVVNWKHSVGKPRQYNLKLLRANSTQSVEQHSQRALEMATAIKDTDDSSLQPALKELMTLKGVGPATASALLSLVRPDIFCYFYDEAIDCFESTRSYTLPVYLRVNRQCLTLASTLGMTTARVATVLWVTARHMALFGVDLSKGVDCTTTKKTQSSSLRAAPDTILPEGKGSSATVVSSETRSQSKRQRHETEMKTTIHYKRPRRKRYPTRRSCRVT